MVFPAVAESKVIRFCSIGLVMYSVQQLFTVCNTLSATTWLTDASGHGDSNAQRGTEAQSS